jgi:hypothetical protein
VNSIFVDTSLPSFMNFAFVDSFFVLLIFCIVVQICIFVRLSLGFSKLSFRFMTFFWVKKLKGSYNICQLLFCVFYFLDISISFTMSPLHPP